MSYSGSSSSDYYSSLPLPPTSTNRKKGRRSVNSFNESSIDSYFRDEGYFSYCGNNTTDSRRTSVSFANLSSNEALDTVEIHEPYFNRFTNAIKDFIHSAQNIRLPRYSSNDSIASLDPDASKPAARFYGRECYSSDSSPESNNKVRFCSPRLGSSSEDSGDGVFMNHHGSNNAQRDKLKTRRISIVEPPVTAFFNNGSPIDQQLVRKVHSMRDAPKSILKKCSVKSEGHNSALQDTKYHIYEVIPEELFRYGEQRPDPRPPLPERPLIRSMAIFPPEYMFQPRSHHAYHRRNAVVID